MLTSFRRVLHRVCVMAVRHMGVMPCQLVIASLVMSRGLAMVSSSLLVMFRSLLVMGRAFVRCHAALRLVVDTQA
jgi:hypothetical protein